MRLAFTTAKLITVWLFVILVNNSGAVAQSKANGISISLSVSSTEFTRAGKPRAELTVVNRSGASISLESFGSFGLELELNGRPVDRCRLDECFSATVFPRDGQLA